MRFTDAELGRLVRALTVEGREDELGPLDLTILLVLSSRIDQDMTTEPTSYATLRQITRMDVATIKLHLQALTKAGFIRRAHYDPKLGGTPSYQILRPTVSPPHVKGKPVEVGWWLKEVARWGMSEASFRKAISELRKEFDEDVILKALYYYKNSTERPAPDRLMLGLITQCGRFEREKEGR